MRKTLKETIAKRAEKIIPTFVKRQGEYNYSSTTLAPLSVASAVVLNYCNPPFIGKDGHRRELILRFKAWLGYMDKWIEATYHSRAEVATFAWDQND